MAKDQANVFSLAHQFQLVASALFPVLGKRLCTTGGGNRYGVVPPFSEPGDLICAFSGASEPFLCCGGCHKRARRMRCTNWLALAMSMESRKGS